MTDLNLTARIFSDLVVERHAQDEKWGEQNHPSIAQVLMLRPGGCSPERMAAEYQIPSAWLARRQCQWAAERGEVTWAHILIEEVAEAVEAAVTGQSSDDLRAELVQIAAVAIQWIECLDRRNPPPPVVAVEVLNAPERGDR